MELFSLLTTDSVNYFGVFLLCIFGSVGLIVFTYWFILGE